MMAWDSRLLGAACLPLVLLACPAAETPSDDPDSSNGSDATTTSAVATTNPSGTAATDGPATTSGSGGAATGTASTPDSEGTEVPSTGEAAVCGNNLIEGSEVCDLNQLGGETCASLGYGGGMLGCLLTCEDYNLLGCFICGNEVLDLAEDCEGDFVPKEVTCESLGYEAGWVTCGDDCLYDVSECSICGDGIQAGHEQCDGIDFDGETCISQGFAGGNLGCNLTLCEFVLTGCV